MITLSSKICYNCQKDKPLSEFGVYKKRKDGLRYECKECQHKSEKRWRQARRSEKRRYSQAVSRDVLPNMDKYILRGDVAYASKYAKTIRSSYFLSSDIRCRLKVMELAVEQMAERAKE